MICYIVVMYMVLRVRSLQAVRLASPFHRIVVNAQGAASKGQPTTRVLGTANRTRPELTEVPDGRMSTPRDICRDHLELICNLVSRPTQ